jgi:hypothetical protein
VRTDPGAVQAILGEDYDKEAAPSLAPRIRIAGLIVDRLVTYGADVGVTVSEEEAAELEGWLAAWAYALSDKPYTSNSDGASQSYAGVTGKYLEANLYGQAAVAMDPTGYLQSQITGGVIEATGSYLGRNRNTRLPFWER